MHLCSELSGSEAALEILKKYKFKRLILLGDIFDNLNLKRINKNDWQFLSYIRKLSNPKNDIEIVWIEGNHDIKLSEFGIILGIDVVEKYTWEMNNEKFIAIHGHQFDRFMKNNIVISEIATILYKFLQKLDKKTHRFSRHIKRMSKNWLRLTKSVANHAIEYANHNKYKNIFCGHTHQQYVEKRNNVNYYNIGCFTDKPVTYSIIHYNKEASNNYLIELKEENF